MMYSGLPSPLKAAYFPTFEKKISSSSQFQDKAFRFFSLQDEEFYSRFCFSSPSEALRREIIC